MKAKALRVCRAEYSHHQRNFAREIEAEILPKELRPQASLILSCSCRRPRELIELLRGLTEKGLALQAIEE